MTETSAGAGKRVASADGYISLIRIKSSDGGLRTLLLAVVTTSKHFSFCRCGASSKLKIYVIINKIVSLFAMRKYIGGVYV